ncbi:MerC mercury resistance protein [Aquimarina sp. MAR_2010_214]|uniref:MerC domain-containing protein n=1 Tax=Aquimarina sp. MAR_2010_214 TaxID=1250026 RepID=UPI000C713C2D|nr:MerC domain-containing protein [Aquimarina sp. MAR_2010_214]PKV51700.1 MerC mercury resistance protein [Aquimarina sp. MAR_2010_214]
MIHKTIRVNLDFIGFLASFLCMLHCIFLPIVIAFFPLMGLVFLTDEFYEVFLIGASLMIAMFAIYNGYKKYHGKPLPVFLYLTTLVLFTIGFLIENHFIERILHFLATGFLIIAHYYNWKFTRAYKSCKIKQIHL